MDWIAYGEDWDATSEEASPEDVPAFGIMLIAQRDPEVGRHVLWGADYYVWIEEYGEWNGTDFVGLIDALAHYPGCVVRFGRGIPNDRWQKVRDFAMKEDDRLPRKTASRRGEDEFSR